MTTLQYFRALILICAQRFHTFRRRSKCAAVSRHAPLRQTYALPSPNACRLLAKSSLAMRAADIRPCAVALPATPHAGAIRVLFTRLGPPHGSPVEARCASRMSRVTKKSILCWRRRLRPARRGRAAALSPARGAHFCSERCSRLSAVLISLFAKS